MRRKGLTTWGKASHSATVIVHFLILRIYKNINFKNYNFKATDQW